MYRFLFLADSSEDLRRVARPLARVVEKSGWTAHAMARDASRCETCREGFLQTFESPWTTNPLDPSNWLRAGGRFREFVEREEYDVVHIVSASPGFAARFALRNVHRMRFPRIIYSAQADLGTLRERLALNWTDYLAAHDHRNFAQASTSGILPAPRLSLIPEGYPAIKTRFWTDFYARVLELTPQIDSPHRVLAAKAKRQLVAS